MFHGPTSVLRGSAPVRDAGGGVGPGAPRRRRPAALRAEGGGPPS
ncbi:hypothetical protein FM117_00185 [Micrococcus luteus Mu201]|nr:hypothetical protein FM117_00185 [Micrococcus luteus Mu201]